MRQLQFVAHGEPSDVIELHTVSEPALGEEEVLISMEAAPLNPSDFLFVRGMYGVRPASHPRWARRVLAEPQRLDRRLMLLYRVSES
jgi:NADPH:quinone reductase-like Zn-dependent oxidoreductase